MMFKKKSSQPEGRARTPQVRSSSSHSQVFSYYAKRSSREAGTSREVNEPARAELLKSRRLADNVKRLPSLAGLVVIVLLSIAMLQLSSNAKVKVVESNNQIFLRDRKVYEDAVHKAFTPLLNRNKLTVNTAQISRDLKKQFPELKVASVSLPVVGSQPVVYIQPSAPKVILVGKGGMFLLDSDGRALIGANQVPGLEALHIPVVNDQSNLPLEAGRIVLPQSTVAFITEVTGQMAAKGLKVASMELPGGTNELRVRPGGVGYFVKFNLQGKAREQAGAYLAMKEYLESNGKTPGEYIDVRVENRAYFK